MVRRAASAAPAAPRPSEPGHLNVSSRPWGLLYLDERLVGNTPIADLVVPPGTHRLRIMRDGYRSFERQIRIAANERLRLVDLELEARAP